MGVGLQRGRFKRERQKTYVYVNVKFFRNGDFDLSVSRKNSWDSSGQFGQFGPPEKGTLAGRCVRNGRPSRVANLQTPGCVGCPTPGGANCRKRLAASSAVGTAGVVRALGRQTQLTVRGRPHGPDLRRDGRDCDAEGRPPQGGGNLRGVRKGDLEGEEAGVGRTGL